MDALLDSLKAAAREALGDGVSPADLDREFSLESPRGRAPGHLALSLALKLAKAAGRPPLAVAEDLAAKIRERAPELVAEATAAPPGFVNLTLAPGALAGLLQAVHAQGTAFIRSEALAGRKVLLEFASANPTGPLTVAHGRQAAVGDALGRILAAAGAAVTREYYLNDSGRQIERLGRSLEARVRQARGEEAPLPEEGYRGEYLADQARSLAAAGEDRAKRTPAQYADLAMARILEGIRKDLADFRVGFDSWFSQREFEATGAVESTLAELEKRGAVADRDGARWFEGTRFGDGQDRVLVKSDGEYAYRCPDFAYHRDKFGRGFNQLVNLFGPDHHGHVSCLAAGMRALGLPAENLHTLIVQHCTLYEGKEKKKMSTRAGEFVTLRQVMDEVGVDAARYFFVMRKIESHLDFDLAVAKKKTLENPVYYVQYLHARACSLRRKAAEKSGRDPAAGPAPDLAPLGEADLALAALLLRAREVTVRAAEQLDPARVTNYLADVARAFHRYYQNRENVIVGDDEALTAARLYLAGAVGTVIRAFLELLGVSAPDRM